MGLLTVREKADVFALAEFGKKLMAEKGGYNYIIVPMAMKVYVYVLEDGKPTMYGYKAQGMEVINGGAD